MQEPLHAARLLVEQDACLVFPGGATWLPAASRRRPALPKLETAAHEGPPVLRLFTLVLMLCAAQSRTSHCSLPSRVNLSFTNFWGQLLPHSVSLTYGSPAIHSGSDLHPVSAGCRDGFSGAVLAQLWRRAWLPLAFRPSSFFPTSNVAYDRALLRRGGLGLSVL